MDLETEVFGKQKIGLMKYNNIFALQVIQTEHFLLCGICLVIKLRYKSWLLFECN